ncbi:nucleolar protein 8, partial [Clarias magur]
MKRLYIGGLSHKISQKDLRDQIGKFGEVTDVEIITRKDEHGSPLKTFAYVNVNISDSEYKRCTTVLNKSKWKGGTLQIELAKESFLHRLAEERQQAAEKIRTPRIDAKTKIVESFKAAGVENFHMKSAVPGTEIPGHKLETGDGFTPVSKLTWRLDGGDDEISKKRRGEFPPQKNRPAKTIKSLDPSTIPHSAPPVPERGTTVQDRHVPHLLHYRKPPVNVFYSDADSEDELRVLVAQELSWNHATVTTEDEGNLEVVGDDFVMKSSMFWSAGEAGNNTQLGSKASKDDEEYDSADTDEILTQNKTPGKAGTGSKTSQNNDEKKPVIKNTTIQRSTEPESDDDAESSGESHDSEYEAMMGNCCRLELSLADLTALIKNKENEENDDDDDDDGKAEPRELPKVSPVHKTSPQRTPSKKSGINPEDILASLFGPDEGKEVKKKKVQKSCLPAFVGTKDLFGSTSAEPSGLKRPAEKVTCAFGEDRKRVRLEDEVEPDAALKPSSQQINENAALGLKQSVLDPVKQQQDNRKRLAALEQRHKESEQQKKLIRGALSKVDLPNANKGKHIVFDSDDDITNDTENTAPQKASLFREDSDEDDGFGSEGKQAVKEKVKSEESKKAAGSKLFDSSGDEGDDDDDDDGTDEDRFKIKPQFEGRTGQKLMELQSRFGTDPRFQMDSRFLDSDGEEQEQDIEPQQALGEQELVEEKKKNLSILQSVLNISIQPSDTSKGATKSKIFKDISALHYDPSRETHAAFETKTETPQKESKAARRKKREEATKLPEVSKDIYFDVTMDLKEAFGPVKEIQNEEEVVAWDQDDDDDDDDDDEKKDETPQEDMHAFSFLSNQESEPSSRFKFSFFGDDAVTKKPITEEYKVETIKGAKVAWQVDPRFQDSSAEEEEEQEDEEEEGEEKEEAALVTVVEQAAPTKKFFFFFDDDIRLKVGPTMFCRQMKLEDQREAWEKKRNELRE